MRRGQEGSLLIDALLTVFVTGLTLVACLGLIAVLSSNAIKIDTVVKQYLLERSENAQERTIIFTSE